MYRGSTARSEYIRALLELAIEHKENTKEHGENTDLLKAQREEIDYLRKQNISLTQLVSQSQVLQMQAQKQLAEAQEIENKTRKWWHFWKKG